MVRDSLKYHADAILSAFLPSPTAEQKLAFIVDFARIDLAQLREGDLLNLADECEAFCEFAGIGITGHIEKDKAWRQTTIAEYSAIQQDITRLLHDIYDRRKPAYVRQHHKSLRVHVRGELISDYLRVYGSRRDVILFVTKHMFSQSEYRAGIQRCAAKDCDHIFYRTGKQRYCSRRCTNRAGRQKWLSKKRNQATEAAAARRRYDKRIRSKTSRNVKVQHRSQEIKSKPNKKG